MGNGIAHVFAQTGYHVSLVDIKEEFLDIAFMDTLAGVKGGNRSPYTKTGFFFLNPVVLFDVTVPRVFNLWRWFWAR